MDIIPHLGSVHLLSRNNGYGCLFNLGLFRRSHLNFRFNCLDSLLDDSLGSGRFFHDFNDDFRGGSGLYCWLGFGERFDYLDGGNGFHLRLGLRLDSRRKFHLLWKFSSTHAGGVDWARALRAD